MFEEAWLLSPFRDKEVFSPDYVPERLLFREDRLEMVSDLIEEGETVLLEGPLGVGKTTLVRILERRSHIRIFYVDCSISNTPYRVLWRLNWMAGNPVPSSGLPTDHLTYTLLESPGILREAALVLDHLDWGRFGRRGIQAILYLKRELGFPLVLVSEKADVTTGVRVYLPPYDARELYHILEDRAERGLVPGDWDELLREVAEIAVLEGGSAAYAIALLKNAVRAAWGRGFKDLGGEVQAARSALFEEWFLPKIRELRLSNRFVLFAIASLLAEGRKPTTGEVWRRSNELLSSAGHHPLSRRRVSAIISKLSRMGIIRVRMRFGGNYGNTRVVERMAVEPERLISMFGICTR